MRTKEKIMVKHVISDKKGLVQESGAGIRIDSCITSGYNAPVAHYNVVAGLSTGTGIETVAGAVTSSFSDSGTTYILGSLGGNCLGLPAMTSANIGYTATIIVTGALNNTAIAEAAQDDDRFLLALASRDGAAKIDKITTGTNNLNFVNGCADATQCAIVKVEYINANKAVVQGLSLT